VIGPEGSAWSEGAVGVDVLVMSSSILVDFEGNVSLAQGAICVELTIGSKTLPSWVGIGYMPIVA
jgi:hypothetical protein